MMVSKSLYRRLIENRPFKLSAEEVNYQQSDSVKCAECIHFYTREIDKYHTCEIYRPEEDASVDPDGVCDFFSEDGIKFPLLDPET
jgi:hypothetical protein